MSFLLLVFATIAQGHHAAELEGGGPSGPTAGHSLGDIFSNTFADFLQAMTGIPEQYGWLWCFHLVVLLAGSVAVYIFALIDRKRILKKMEEQRNEREENEMPLEYYAPPPPQEQPRQTFKEVVLSDNNNESSVELEAPPEPTPAEQDAPPEPTPAQQDAPPEPTPAEQEALPERHD